ncbi:MAG: DNA repair protein RecO [Lentimicrobium sp.]|nr:DNA repair protein RecO [Lentimicrobium sp.]
MQSRTRGFVFHVIRYSDSSAIVKIYTENYGLKSYLVKGLYSKKSKLRSALFSNMNMLELIVNHRENRGLNFIGEAIICKNIQLITDDMSRSAVLMFINELLYKCIKEEEPNQNIFSFIETTLDSLSNSEIPIPLFHLLFMLRLTKFLGFAPALSKVSDGGYFDMEEGIFLDSEPLHRYYISGQSALLLEKLQLSDFNSLKEIVFSVEIRNDLLDRLIEFYRLHIPEMGEMKTVRVLHEILS